jgi:hypothetical protein
MQTLIADFLFQHKKIVIPQVGSLQIKHIPAVASFGERSIAAPTPTIEFYSDDTAVNYEASHSLNNISEDIKNIQAGTQYEIAQVGKFYKDDAHKIAFTAYEIPVAFLPQVKAERVIHPNDSHNMLVGETETNTAAMTEYYTDDEAVKKDKWWVWAIVLFVIAFAAIAFYMIQHNGSLIFG